jgi:polysaccharide deacetylase 2 family uncharacterized protein YibQ
MKRRSVQPGTFRFIFIAMVLMLLMDQFIFGGTRSYIEEARQEARIEKLAKEQGLKTPPVRVEPPEGQAFFEAPLPDPEEIPKETADLQTPPDIDEKAKEEPVKPEEKRPVLPKPSVGGAPKIAIIIDDVGMDIKRSRAAINLPAPITLAMLPYAPRVKEIAQEGKDKGHSLIIHTPMEAMDASVNIGPGGLRSDMTPEQMDVAFGAMLKSFDGYEGINNHMGSRLTQDKAAMDRIMSMLSERALFFVDSKTIQSSVAAQEAASSGVPFAERDVFIDHVETLEFARKALKQTEALALRRGYAIAIGHPKDNTIAALKEWIPTLAEKGIELVPVSRLLVKPKASVQEVKAVPAETPPVPLDMFPEEQVQQITPSANASDEPAIQLHPLPSQSPSP